MPWGSAAVLLVPELEPIPRLELAIKHRGERPDRHHRERSPSQDGPEEEKDTRPTCRRHGPACPLPHRSLERPMSQGATAVSTARGAASP